MSVVQGHGSGQLLGQTLPSVTTPVTLFTNDGSLIVEITLLMTAVVSGAANTDLSVYHDDDGTTYDNTTLIGTAQRGPTSEGVLFQAQHPGSGIMVKPGGSIGVAASVADDVNFTVYGVTQSAAERTRR